MYLMYLLYHCQRLISNLTCWTLLSSEIRALYPVHLSPLILLTVTGVKIIICNETTLGLTDSRHLFTI